MEKTWSLKGQKATNFWGLLKRDLGRRGKSSPKFYVRRLSSLPYEGMLIMRILEAILFWNGLQRGCAAFHIDAWFFQHARNHSWLSELARRVNTLLMRNSTNLPRLERGSAGMTASAAVNRGCPLYLMRRFQFHFAKKCREIRKERKREREEEERETARDVCRISKRTCAKKWR